MYNVYSLGVYALVTNHSLSVVD